MLPTTSPFCASARLVKGIDLMDDVSPVVPLLRRRITRAWSKACAATQCHAMPWAPINTDTPSHWRTRGANKSRAHARARTRAPARGSTRGSGSGATNQGGDADDVRAKVDGSEDVHAGDLLGAKVHLDLAAPRQGRASSQPNSITA